MEHIKTITPEGFWTFSWIFWNYVLM
jgi:hypothetical protein